MQRYQIRLQHKELGALFDEIANAAWDEISRMALSDPKGAGAGTGREAMKKALSRFLASHMHQFAECGTALYCGVEAIVSRPLAAEPELPSEREDPNLREDATIYTLDVEHGLDKLVESMASVAWSALVDAHATPARKLSGDERTDLTAALARALAPYVYQGSECGDRWQCHHAHEVALR
jgi:hypothetical protein